MTAPIEDPKAFLTDLFRSAVDAADPMKVTAQYLPEKPKGRLFVIGAGKASARMAEAVEAIYGPCEGYVITRYGYARPCQGIEIVEAAHPVPDEAGLNATRQLLGHVQDLSEDDTILALISGGGSALLCAPTDGLTLQDKQHLNQALLASGAPISEMNTVRAQFSDVKAGQLARACHPAKIVSLLISDVPGDNPAEIASGPTVVGESSAQKAIDILQKWQIDLPEQFHKVLERRLSETPSEPAALAEDQLHIIAAPSQSLTVAAKQAEAAGCDVGILGDAIEGEARDLAAEHVALAIARQAKMTATDRPLLLLSGGECTVTRTGSGIGGPNAEYTLAALCALDGQAGIHVLACDTDGVDGAAEVAGAYAGPETLSADSNGITSAKAALADNDAHRYFESIRSQIVTGPTLTNVNDFRAILIFPIL